MIATIDKDLLMVPGLHYNFNKDEFCEITKHQGLLNFYQQILTGDRVDDIPGIKGIGPKKAAKILKDCTTEEEMYDAVDAAYYGTFSVQETYAGWAQEHTDEVILRNGRLLYMRTKEDELWKPPTI